MDDKRTSKRVLMGSMDRKIPSKEKMGRWCRCGCKRDVGSARTEAVSYTHLDVYKRQDGAWALYIEMEMENEGSA